jgi:hypothetical protein
MISLTNVIPVSSWFNLRKRELGALSHAAKMPAIKKRSRIRFMDILLFKVHNVKDGG